MSEIELVIGRELEIYGSHGLAAADYAKLLALVASGKLDPRRLVHRTISLAEAEPPVVINTTLSRAGRLSVWALK